MGIGLSEEEARANHPALQGRPQGHAPTIHGQMASQAHLLRFEAVFFLVIISGKIVAVVAVVAVVAAVAIVLACGFDN